MRAQVAALLAAGALVVAWGVGDRKIFGNLAQVASPLPRDLISRHEARLLQLAPELPRDGTYGFVGDGDVVARHYAAQYALSPRFIERGTRPALIIGFFDGPARQLMADHKLKLVKHFRQGVMLLEKEP